MLIIAAEKITLCSIPACSPELTVVVKLAKLGALVGREGQGVDDAARLDQAGAQADSFAGVLLTKAPEKRWLHSDNELDKKQCSEKLLCKTFQNLVMRGSSRRMWKAMMKNFLQLHSLLCLEVPFV